MYNMMVACGLPEYRLRWIPTFVNGTVFRPNSDFAKDNYIVYVGRLEATKGVHVLVEAISLLHRRRPEVKLGVKIVGSGDKEYTSLLCQKVRNSGLQNVIRFVGKLNANDLSSLIAKAQLSVVPSLWYENFPNAILESYACGTPVLASNLGSLKECVKDGETGYLFRPGDSACLVERLEYCLDNTQQVMDMAQKAREVATSTYSAQMHINSLEKLFNELVGKF
jgi:glycosyltransferase involved in cell wall biosynthesis